MENGKCAFMFSDLNCKRLPLVNLTCKHRSRADILRCCLIGTFVFLNQDLVESGLQSRHGNDIGRKMQYKSMFVG